MELSLGFHMIFAAIGVAMPLLMLIAEWRWIKYQDAEARRLAHVWAKLTAVTFAIGAVSGTALSFELGLLWPRFMAFAGPLIGPAFALYVKMALACGAVFQMPVLVFALARMGMVTAGFLLRNFKYAVLIIAILGAVLSPGGDIASQMILSGPMLVLYIISIGVAWAFQKRKPAAEAAS